MYRHNGAKELAILTDGQDIFEVKTIWADNDYIKACMQRDAVLLTGGNCYWVFRSLDVLCKEIPDEDIKRQCSEITGE